MPRADSQARGVFGHPVSSGERALDLINVPLHDVAPLRGRDQAVLPDVPAVKQDQDLVELGAHCVRGVVPEPRNLPLH